MKTLKATEVLSSLQSASERIKGDDQFALGMKAGLAQAKQIVEQIQAAPWGGGFTAFDDASLRGNGWVGYVTGGFTRWMGSKIGEEKWLEIVLFDPDGVEKPFRGGLPAKQFQTFQSDAVVSIRKSAPKHDAVTVTEGAYRGWVGYLKALGEEGVTVALFSPNGETTEQDLPYDSVFCMGD